MNQNINQSQISDLESFSNMDDQNAFVGIDSSSLRKAKAKIWGVS
jgi:hypothetical protein